MIYEKKIKVKCPLPWSHHHSGWPFCVNALRKNFHNEDGISLYTNGVVQEIIYSKKTHHKTWAAFIHATPDEQLQKQMNQNPYFLKSLKNCVGLFAMSNYVEKFIKKNIKNIATDTIFLAVEKPKFYFDFNLYNENKNKKIIMAGHWLRNFETFYNLKSWNHQKTILKCTNKKHPKDFFCLPYLDSDNFEKIFIDNIMFLSLKDASANNFVVECIVRNTPILINELPATKEYLGNNYPLFYKNQKEAEEKIQDLNLINETHRYLSGLNKEPFTLNGFVKNFNNSKIYKNINLKKILI